MGAIVKGDDQGLIAAKLIPAPRLKKIYGREFGNRLAEALTLCIGYAEKFYTVNPLSNKWSPPLEGFFISKMHSSVAESIEEGLLRAAMQCSSFSISLEVEKSRQKIKSALSAPESWRQRITEAVTVKHANFAHYFEQRVPIRGSGVPFKFSFLSGNYAAQFDAIAETRDIQHGLVRAQSKLWQLDRLRDEGALFPPKFCELLLQTPVTDSETEKSALDEFIEELEYEASRRELGIYAAESPVEAAKHLIEKAA